MTHHQITTEFAEELKRQVEEGFNSRDPKVIERVLAPGLIDHNKLLGGVDLGEQRGQRRGLCGCHR